MPNNQESRVWWRVTIEFDDPLMITEEFFDNFETGKYAFDRYTSGKEHPNASRITLDKVRKLGSIAKSEITDVLNGETEYFFDNVETEFEYEKMKK